MKKLTLITITAVLLIVAGGCTTGRMASTGVYYDDIYYAPDLTKANKEQAFAPVPSIVKEEEKQIKKEENRQIRNYERSNLSREQRDTRDFSEIQNKYASILADDETENVDSLLYYNDETGYWVDGFEGSEMDRDYAERLIRFHGPFTRISYWSPLYNQFVYFNDPDWNVYVDGNYAYAFPTWSNPWYDSYRYNWSSPWHSSFYFGIGSYWGYPYSSYYSWYDPFYSSYYSWGFGWPYYHYPYYNHWYHPYHHYYSHDNNRRGVYRGLRPSMRTSNTRYSNTSPSRSSNTLKRTGSNTGRTVRTTPSGTRIIQNADGSTIATNSKRNTQRIISGSATLKSEGQSSQSRSISRYQGGSGASSGTIQTRSRRSSTPTYSQPGNASRPSYNRTGSYSRPSNSNTRTYNSNSDLKSGSQTQRKTTVRSQTRTYNSGSSSQQRSNIRTRSYTPSQSGASRSSSSYRSTPTRSSGSSYSGSRSSSSSGSRSSGSSSGNTVRRGRR
jgi:hypothetical protein